MSVQDSYDSGQNPRKIARWIWWIYLLVGCFIVFLLIWMFIALSNHNMKMEQQEDAIYQTEVPATTAPGLPPSQL